MKKVQLTNYFDIIGANQSDKINFEVSSLEDLDAIPFLGRSSSNNGVVDYVKPKDSYLNEGGVLTIALDGSTGATFYQHHDFYSGQNIWLLKPKRDLIPVFNPIIAIFLTATISRAVEEYSYNLSLTKTRLLNIEIKLPINSDGVLDVEYIEKRMKSITNASLIENVPSMRY